MGSKTIEERIDEQEKDDGNLEEKVLVIQTTWSSHYHESEDCKYLSTSNDSETEEIKRKNAQRKWLAPCHLCVLDE